jgi:hypothetical protein
MKILALSRRAALSLAGALGVSALVPARAIGWADPELPIPEAFAGLSLDGATLAVKRGSAGTVDCFDELAVIYWRTKTGRYGYIFPDRDTMRRSQAVRIVADIQAAIWRTS